MTNKVKRGDLYLADLSFAVGIRTDGYKTGIDHSKQQGKQIQSYNDHCLSFLQDPFQSQDPDTLSVAGIKRA